MVPFLSGDGVQKGVYKISTSSPLGKLTGLRIEAMQDGRLPRGGPGRAPNDGSFVLTELEVTARPTKFAILENDP